jgi:hypothetical protein
MPFCPQCQTEYQNGASRCADCDVDLVPHLIREYARGDGSNWVSVYQGPDVSVRMIEMRLRAFGIPTQRLAAEPTFGALTEFHTPHLAGYKLMVPTEAAQADRERIESAIKSSSWEGGPEEDAAAAAEAEEDYDVRACASCGLYFHDNYTHCPGCGAELVAAVEVFEAGQLEPDRVIVADGIAAEARTLAERFCAAGFGAEAFEVEGWPVCAVDLPWGELIDRTEEAEALLRS